MHSGDQTEVQISSTLAPVRRAGILSPWGANHVPFIEIAVPEWRFAPVIVSDLFQTSRASPPIVRYQSFAPFRNGMYLIGSQSPAEVPDCSGSSNPHLHSATGNCDPGSRRQLVDSTGHALAAR
jgi:hypothetical protein